MDGSERSFLYRRSSDSDAHRYCVGFSPIRANARRQAWISGSSASDPPASRASALAHSRATRSVTSASAVIPAASTTPAASSGKSVQIFA